MSIDISNNLLKSIQQELLASLRTVEVQIADLIEFDDIQEVDKILDTLHIVEGTLVMLSETMAAAVCNYIYKNIKLISKDTDAQIKQDELLFAFLTLVHSIGIFNSEISQVSLQNVHSLLESESGECINTSPLDVNTIFPVSEETIETIAFSIKKELSVTKNLVEENLDNLTDKVVKDGLYQSLVMPFAVFKLLNYYAGIELIKRTKNLLKSNTIKENIEEFTDNIILLEDALWQLSCLKTQEVESSQGEVKISQAQHSRTITSQAAKFIFAKIAYLFFKELREEIVENFDNPDYLDSLDMMRLAEEFHRIATTTEFFQEHRLAKLLYGSEQRHLFFCQEKEVIKQPDINKFYLDLIVTYEIIFEQLQSSNDIDKHAIALIEAAQKQLLANINFAPEKIATPDYYYASNDDVLANDIEDDSSDLLENIEAINDTGEQESFADVGSLDLPVSADIASPMGQSVSDLASGVQSDTDVVSAPTETVTDNVDAVDNADSLEANHSDKADEVLENHLGSQSTTQSADEQLAAVEEEQVASDNTDVVSQAEPKEQLEEQPEKGSIEYIYQQLTDSGNLSINNEINSIAEEEIDEEILEIFIEEGHSISDLLKQETPRLQDNYFDEELIATLRRAYHTLKGSGKMVGLNVFGEFAWQHEELLNRVVAGECQLNEIALRQFIKAQQIVEESMNTEPFVEDKEKLLLAAAQAEVIKDVLLGKVSMPELNQLDDTDTNTITDIEEAGTDSETDIDTATDTDIEASTDGDMAIDTDTTDSEIETTDVTETVETPIAEIPTSEELSLAEEEVSNVEEPSTDVETDAATDTDIEASTDGDMAIDTDTTDSEIETTDATETIETPIAETPASEELSLAEKEVSNVEEPSTDVETDIEASTDGDMAIDTDTTDSEVETTDATETIETPIAETPASEELSLAEEEVSDVEESSIDVETDTDIEVSTDTTDSDIDVVTDTDEDNKLEPLADTDKLSPMLDTGVLSDLLATAQVALNQPQEKLASQDSAMEVPPVTKDEAFRGSITGDIENIADLLDDLRTADNRPSEKRYDILNDIHQQLDTISEKASQLDYSLGREMAERLQESVRAIQALPKGHFPKMLLEYIRSTVKEFTKAEAGESNLDGFKSIIEEMDSYIESLVEEDNGLHNADEKLLEVLGSPATTRENIKDILSSLNISQDIDPAQPASQTPNEPKAAQLSSDIRDGSPHLSEKVTATSPSKQEAVKQTALDELATDTATTQVIAIKDYAHGVEPHVQSSKSHFSDWKQGRFTESRYRNNLSSNINDITRLSEQYKIDSATKLGQSTSGLLSKLAEENIQPAENTAASIETAVNEFERLQKAIDNDADSSEQEVRPTVIQEVVSKVIMRPEELGRPLDLALNNTAVIAGDNLFNHSNDPVIIDDYHSYDARLENGIRIDDGNDNIIGNERMPETISEDSYGIRSDNPLDLDETILAIFLEEAKDISKTNQECLEDWKEDYNNVEAIQKLQRGMHTLKGGSRMAGLTVLGDLSHYVETLLERLIDGTIKNKYDAQKILEEANDISTEMIRLAGSNKVIYEAPDYIEKLNSFLEGETGKSLDYNRLEKSEEATEKRVNGYTKKREQGYTLRIQSEVMDRISSLVGEGVIRRIRMERGSLEHSYQLDELSRVITRFREQLRRLETQTEAQILFRHNTDTDSNGSRDSNFDPLELDRFSEIQQLSRQLAESMDDLYGIGRNLRFSLDIARQALISQEKIQKELRDVIVTTSVVRFDSIYLRMNALIKQVSKESNKSVQLEIQGGNIEIERNILEKLIPGFEHAVRNSIAHGIESEEERKQKGKDPIGRIRLSAHRKGAEIWFTIADDGRGANIDAIRNKARKLGLLDEKQADDKNYLLQLLFKQGFSTANKVTQVFGRGVGLDVLKDVVRESHGSIEVDTKVDKGMTICIRLPFTMSIADVLPVRIGRYSYAIPIISIEGVIRISAATYEKYISGEFTHYYYGQYTYRLESLVNFLDPSFEKTLSPHGVPALLAKIGNRRIAFEVGEIGTRQEIIIKSVNRQFTALPGIIGATILDSGRPVPVMEIPTLGRYFLENKDSRQIKQKYLEQRVTNVKEKTRILVVDDSITIRKVSTKILGKYDVEVKTAKDGLDAIDVTSSWIPNLILLDIEMPRMDGFEFATYIRNTKEYKDLPIIMITSRTGEKHKEQARSIGINEYLGKPYVEETLVKTIETVLNKTIEK